jgi:acetyl esterase/lipase
LVGRGEGAHLALMVAYGDRPAGLKGVVALHPLVDLKEAWSSLSEPGRERLTALLGAAPEEESDAYVAASPLNRVDGTVVPTLLVSGGRDQRAPASQAAALASELTAAGVENLHLELSWAAHGCEANPNGPCGQLTTWAVRRFLQR